MLLSLVYFAVRRLLLLLTRGREDDDVAREIEILVLRHQLRVLARGRRMPEGCIYSDLRRYCRWGKPVQSF